MAVSTQVKYDGGCRCSTPSEESNECQRYRDTEQVLDAV